MGPKRHDYASLQTALKDLLIRIGLCDSQIIQKQLKISQPVFSRLAATMRTHLLVVGRARATRYALRRSVDDVGESVPVYEILEDGTCRKAAFLHTVFPKGFVVESLIDTIPEGYYDDLPYFLDGLRPMGFLGRLIPHQHPDLMLPPDIRNWSAEHCLRYLCRFGWNLSGNLLVGEETQKLWKRNVLKPPDLVDSSERRHAYPVKARAVLSNGVPGSSAAGEHPKFLATLSPEGRAVLVKFELNTRTVAGRRSADLLVAEHIAHEVLADHGQVSTKSELVFGTSGELFLETERFDRVAVRGRRGLISLQSLDSQFAGRLHSWSDSAQALATLGHIKKDMVRDIRWIELFGHFIGNTDMHPGNVSFVSSGARILKLAPVYDMLPMHYAPREFAEVDIEELRVPEWIPPARREVEEDLWASVLSAAVFFWKKLSLHPDVSRSFRSIALGNIEKLRT
jgi:hypothetical protein